MTDNKKFNILVVDDTPENLHLLVEILQEHNFNVRPVPSGVMALKVVEKIMPDLILLDVNMPQLNGYETCDKLKQIDKVRDIPVIFLSAMSETSDKLKAFNSGGVDYITKPYHIEEVIARVNTQLKISHLQRELEEANLDLEDKVKKRTEEVIRLNEAKKLFELELKVASEIQKDMMPLAGKVIPFFDGLVEAYGESHSAKKVEGDFFDFFKLSDTKLFFCISDVSGKGIPAAIFMSKVKSILCYEVKRDNVDFQDMLKSINNELISNNSECMFASILLGWIDIKAKKISCCNAGHTYPLVMNDGKKFNVSELKKHPVIGVFPSSEEDYDFTEFDYKEGDTFFLYSDGITEAINSDNEMYGIDRMVDSVNRADSNSVFDIISSVNKDLSKYTEGVEQSDDITTLAIRYK